MAFSSAMLNSVDGNDGSGDDGNCDDGSWSDGKCNGGSSGNDDSYGSGKATKTTAATAMAVGGNTIINKRGDNWKSNGNRNGDGDRQQQ